MKRLSKRIGLWVCVLMGAITLQVYAVEDSQLSDLPQLKPESQQVTASKRIGGYFTRYHYTQLAVSPELSEQVFERYLKLLDYNRIFLLEQDIKPYQGIAPQFLDQLQKGELDAAYELYNAQLKRRFERYAYALSILEDEYDFEQEGERFYYDRSEKPWAAEIQELDAFWQQYVRNDALNLALAGRSSEEIKENLIKRYKSAMHRLTQAQSEDAFQLLMNAFGQSVDAHTSYLSPRNAERFRQNMELSLEGIGAVLQAEYDYTMIRSLVPGGPADRSGQLKPEDKIIAVAQGDQDFVDVIGWRLDDVVDLITGPKGSVVRLQVLSGTDSTAGTPKVIELTREKVRLEDRVAKLEVKEIDDLQLGVIEIPGFYNNLTADVKKLLQDLDTKGVAGLVIDLRGNGGGSLDEAIKLSGLFIKSGPVVQVRDSSGRVNVSADQDSQIYYQRPLVVLVNRHSASASEIFASAMQDYGRALIVGEQTFGKGTVQQHRGLERRFDFYKEPMGSVQFTIAKFYRINGGSTQHKGVVPDILFPSPFEPGEFGESKAENALPWDQIDSVSYQKQGLVQPNIIQQLQSRYEERIAHDPEFTYLYEDIQQYKDNQDKNYLSLVKSERLQENEQATTLRLQRVNARLQADGLEAVENIDDVDDKYQEVDIFLRETLSITRDYVVTLMGDAS